MMMMEENALLSLEVTKDSSPSLDSIYICVYVDMNGKEGNLPWRLEHLGNGPLTPLLLFIFPPEKKNISLFRGSKANDERRGPSLFYLL